jgi:hypothetical protein
MPLRCRAQPRSFIMYSAADYVEMLIIHGECGGRLERQQGFMPNVFLTGIITITKRSSVLSHEQSRQVKFYQIEWRLMVLPGLYALLRTKRLF